MGVWCVVAEFEEGMIAHLTAQAGVTALLGTPPRIHPGQIQQGGTLPAVWYELVDSDRPGALAADIGLVWADYVFSAVSVTYLEAKAVIAALRTALKRQGWVQAGITCEDAQLTTEVDDLESDIGAGLYVVAAEYRFNYRE